MRKFLYFMTILLIAGLFSSSFADRRYFGRSYLAYTLPMGAFEFELWNTGLIGKDAGYFYRFQPRFEFEYGITDRLSASFYFNFDQVIADDNNFTSKPLSFSANSLELRYRLSNPDEWFVDPALYFEFAYGGDELGYETKAIFSKRFGSLISVVNLSGEVEREIIENVNESEFELTAGLMYDLNPGVALGIEFRNNRLFEGIYDEEESQASYIGPTINFQTSSFFLTFNFLAQVGGSPSSTGNLDLIHHEKYEFRTILGVDL
ncbi:MAG TPA: hypothetical protein VKD08_15680 [Ignavibacteriaceae bacterium]|jgi:hypothetical protein|nr:hypothetical protein [Ignavibacteriaceae bacterium]